MPPNPSGGVDEFSTFYLECERICAEAQFILHSLPNAKIPAVERAIHQLCAIQQILPQLNDVHASDNDINTLIISLGQLIHPLENFLHSPPPHPSTNIPLHYTSQQGRPSYTLDIARALELHQLGNTWQDIAKVLGVTERTLYRRLEHAGIGSTRRLHSNITDEALDVLVAQITQSHPFVGSTIVLGHLEAQQVYITRARVQESLRRVDAMGVLIRWSGIIKRRVYRVRGANALWHIDGNEKLRPWGFYVHGCVDGHSRLIIYLSCCPNKRAKTVSDLYTMATDKFGWPSRARGDFGTENNEVERLMIEHWGDEHHAFLRGRSLHNVQIERLWRDMRKDCLEAFRQVFFHLEENGLLDMDQHIHQVCLFLVFHKRVQDSLDRARDAWNLHKLRTERNKTPVAIYELSREKAMQRGYWTGDPGDINIDPNNYGVDPEGPVPLAEDLQFDPEGVGNQPEGAQAERDAGIAVNHEDDLQQARDLMGDYDFNRDDGNWGINVYCEAVILLTSKLASAAE